MVAGNNNRDESVTLKDAHILFRNFQGRAAQYNTEGNRNFHVVLTEEQAKDLKARNWRVKQMKPREDGEEGDYHLKVTVNYKTGRPPRVVLISSQGRTELGPDEVGMLDVADIRSADMVLNGWYSDMAGGGYGAFLKTMFVKIREDELELLYAINPDAEDPKPGDDFDNWNE